ncbi:uncharacterized protein LOC135809827 [Sycon ciliatum]|uniref:uncharacterized protein LOC135809826 n=1 Tax=Sycon ciliatum TaxID=27933 RepID=UPI0031F6A1FB
MWCRNPVFLPSDEVGDERDQLQDVEQRKAECAANSSKQESDEQDEVAASGGTEPQAERRPSQDSTNVVKPQFALANKDRKNLWAKKKSEAIKVYFTEDHPKRDRVLPIASEWSQHCSISFVEVTDRSDSEVRVSFKEKEGSYSRVGTDALRIPKDECTMNLAVIDKSTVLHEFGHVLGLLHEHQSPIKGIVLWNVPKVMAEFTGSPNYWDEEQIQRQILEPFKADDVTGSTYDMQSIMHYRFPKGLILSIDGRPTQDSDFPVISELSPTDKLVVRKLYGPPGTKPAPPKEEPQTLPEDADKSKNHISPGEEMKFTFTSDPKEKRKYTIETTGDEADLALTLYGPDIETRFIAAATDGGEDGNPRVVHPLLPAKTYYIVIRAFAKGGAFALRISTVFLNIKDCTNLDVATSAAINMKSVKSVKCQVRQEACVSSWNNQLHQILYYLFYGSNLSQRLF